MNVTILFLYSIFFLIVFLGFAEKQNISLAFKDGIGLFLIILLIIISTYRAPGFGSDDFAYVEMFSDVYKYICTDLLCDYRYSTYGVEFGFYIFMLFLAQFGCYHQILFGMVSWFSLSVNWLVLKKLCPYLLPSLLLYFSHHYLNKEINALRLSMASALVFYSGLCCANQRYSRAVVTIFFGCFFQVSAILALVPIILCYCLLNLRSITYFFIGAVVFGALFPVDKVYEWISYFDFIGEKINLYSASDEYNYKIGFFDVVNIKNFVIVSLCLYFYKSIHKNVFGFRVSLIFFMYATLVRFVFSDFAIIGGRGFGIISVFECVLIPLLIERIFGKKTGYFVIVLYALFVFSLNIFVNTRWSGGVGYFGDMYLQM